MKKERVHAHLTKIRLDGCQATNLELVDKQYRTGYDTENIYDTVRMTKYQNVIALEDVDLIARVE